MQTIVSIKHLNIPITVHVFVALSVVGNPLENLNAYFTSIFELITNKIYVEYATTTALIRYYDLRPLYTLTIKSIIKKGIFYYYYI